MLRNVRDLEGYAITAAEGAIGHVKDFYFDDEQWVIRYFVVEAGSWLASRTVLISPISVGVPEWRRKQLPVRITREQVEKSPGVDTHKPVSRQHEMDYLMHYGYPSYWDGAGLWGEGIYPSLLLPGYDDLGATSAAAGAEAARVHENRDEVRRHEDDPHLRSCQAVTGYHIRATDGEIGHVEGLLVDDSTWAILYLVVNTSNWWLGHKVLIAPAWIQDVSWFESTVSIKVTRQAVKDSPPYDPNEPLDHEQEMRLYRHYGRPGFWAGAEIVESDTLRI